jgi:glycosyltransferase involved in cell wall biosynthesis
VTATKVSIVIPCYNREALVGHAIESALVNGDGAEIIVVDDGSTDASWDRISVFGDLIRSFRIPNGGVSAARNFGMERASGTFIKFLDSDDRLPRGAIKALLEAQSVIKPHQIAFGDASSIGPTGEAIAPFGYGYAGLAPPGVLSRTALFSGTMSPYLPLYPVQALHRVGGFNIVLDLGEDQELAIRVVLAGFQFFRIPVIVAEVREHLEPRLSRTGAADLYRRQILVFLDIIRQLHAATPPITQNEARALARTIWIIARNAARNGFEVEAKEIFKIAIDLTGSIQAAPILLRPLYILMNPIRVEKVVEFTKHLLRSIKL